MERYSGTGQSLLEELNGHTRITIPVGLCKHMKTSSALVLGVLLLLRGSQLDEDDPIIVRQTDIGEFLGFTLMTVSRCYKELRALGVISCARQGMNPQYQVTINMLRITELISSK